MRNFFRTSFLISGLFVPFFALAQTAENPIRTPLFQSLFNKLSTFAAAVTLAGAVIAVIIAGFIYTTSQGNPESLKKARSIIKWSIIAVVIALLLPSTFILLGALGIDLSEVAYTPDPQPLQDTFTGSIDGAQLDDGFLLTLPEVQAVITAPGEGMSFDQGPTFTTCVRAETAPFASYINQAASLYGVSSARLQAIIMAESAGNPNAVSSKNAVGLMQILPSTAAGLDPVGNQGLTTTQIAQKLRDPAYNINLGTQYYADLLRKYGNATLASAAYNGGPVANNPSINCPGMLRWQCQWDNNAHTIPNTGYSPTRFYTVAINTTEANINSGNCQ